MSNNIFSWETEFNQAKQTITHVFNERVKVVLDQKEQIIELYKDSEIIQKCFIDDNYTVTQYHHYLETIAQSANELKELEPKTL